MKSLDPAVRKKGEELALAMFEKMDDEDEKEAKQAVSSKIINISGDETLSLAARPSAVEGGLIGASFDLTDEFHNETGFEWEYETQSSSKKR